MIDISRVSFKTFAAGELHVMSNWLYDINNTCHDSILCRIKCSDDLVKLLLFVNAYDNVFKLPSVLLLPYVPYARQDRIANKGEALSIKVFTNLINSLKFDNVIILDPHSDVTPALLNNVRVIPQEKIWGNYLQTMFDSVDLVAPDAGSLKRIYNLAEVMNCPRQHVSNIRVGTKHRDTLTRKVTHTTIEGFPQSDVAIIVDDICDEGDTAIELAKLVKKDYKKLLLCVTHGIFSKGLNRLFEYFDEVHTTNSWNGNLKPEGNLFVQDVKRFSIID